MESVELNSRHGNRMSPTHDNAMVHGLTPTPIPVAVIDESFGGIGIAVPLKLTGDDARKELTGRELTVEYSGVSCTAVIRHVKSMQSGCRLGLEWKAQALSRCLRDLLKLQPNVGEELSRILPGGLSMMWKMYEAGRWHVMAENASRLLRQIAAYDIDTLVQPIELFSATLERVCAAPDDESSKETVHDALNELIQECIRVIS